MKELNSKAFDSAIKEGKVLVDVNAVWCGPCRAMKPILEEAEKAHKDVKFYGLDFDDNEDLAEKLDVSAIPTIILFEDGKEVNRNIGLISKEQLEDFLA